MKRFTAIICIAAMLIFGVFVFSNTEEYDDGSMPDIIEEQDENNTLDPNSSSGESNTEYILYNSLDSSQQTLYKSIFDGMINYQDTIDVSYSDIDELNLVAECVWYDHPEIFWYSGSYSYTDNEYMPQYDYSAGEIEDLKSKIESSVSKAYSSIDTTNEYTISKTAYDWLVRNISYDYDNLPRVGEMASLSNLEGALVNGKCVCAGYARAYEYILQHFGLKICYVRGMADNGDGKPVAHAWNYMCVDGKYYFADPTWGDGYEDTDNEIVSYEYYGMSGASISVDHDIDAMFSKLQANDGNGLYYQTEKCQLDSYSSSAMKEIIGREIDNGERVIQVQFTNNNEYEKAKAAISSSEVYDLLGDKVTKYSYGTSDNRMIILIFV